jgi:hypothetical protein
MRKRNQTSVYCDNLQNCLYNTLYRLDYGLLGIYMPTQKRAMQPPLAPEDYEALEEVRDLLDSVDTSTVEGEAFALKLLRERGLPEDLIYISKNQPKELPADAAAWAEQVLRRNGVLR